MRILLFADIHIGAIKDCDYVYDVMSSIIDKEIMFTKTDVVVILGDYFDRLFKVNEEYVSLAINVMSYLIRACRKNGTKIRIVYGTESHEMNQYRLFNYHFASSSVDIKLFTTATEETINGKKILYLPEEYISNKLEFYREYLYSGKHYNYIFGHGIIEEGMPQQSLISNPSNLENKVARFRTDELGPAADVVVFGHVHTGYNKGNVYYLGSLFRYKFGEEPPKCYGVITDSEITLVENDKAYIYNTYEFDESSEVYESTDKLVSAIEHLKAENEEIFNGKKVGKIRLIFHTPANVDPAFGTTIKEILFNDKIMKLMIKESSQITEEDGVEEETDEYEFVLDNTMKIDDKIFTFIGMTHEDHMTLAELIRYIHEPLTV